MALIPGDVAEGVNRAEGGTCQRYPGYDSRLRHIGLGARHRGKSIVLFVADRDVRIVSEDGELLRRLVLDPSRDYQRQSA